MIKNNFFTRKSYHTLKELIKNKIVNEKVNVGKVCKKGTAVVAAVALITSGGFFSAPIHTYAEENTEQSLIITNPNAGTTFQRFAGDSRYETAVDISSKNWYESYSVVLARGDSFPDALAGAVLANS